MPATPSPRIPLKLAVPGIICAAVLTLSACSGGAEKAAGAGEGSLSVVATTTQLADFAAQVGGDDISLTGLLAPGGSAHHFDPSPADLLTLGNADVLIVNGLGLESFIDSAIEASGFDGEIITAAEGLDPELLEEITAEGESGETHDPGHDHGEPADTEGEHVDEPGAAEEKAHTDEPAHTDDHEHEHDHDHDHGSINPHIWTSPKNAKGMVSMIAGDLARIDPAHADDYIERSDAYLAQLTELDSWAAAQIERVPVADRVMVSGHDSLRYFLHDYGIEFAGSILPSFEDNAEPSAADIDALVATIRDRGVKAVFVESSMSPKLAQTIAREAGVSVVDADTLYADSLGAAGSDGEKYIGATAHNTRLMLEAWGVEPAPLPASLQ